MILIIKNATALQFEPPSVQEGVDIIIENDKIIQVGVGAASEYRADKTVEAEGDYVFPGLVCSHNHFYSGLARGILAKIAPCPDFVSVLKNLWWRLDRAIDEEILYYSGLICSLEAIRSGCTSVIDHHASPNFIKGSLSTLKKGFEKANLRGMTCYEVTARNGQAEMVAGVEENVEFAALIEAEKRAGGSYLVEAAIGGHAPFTLPDEALRLLGEAVAKTGRGAHIHVAEDKYDVTWAHHISGKDILERLNDFGLINDKALMVHGVFLSAVDIEILNAADGFLLHNARSNMNNNVGYSTKLSSVKNLALGTDGIGANMYEEFKFAYFKHKDTGGEMWPDSYLKFLWNGNEIISRYFGEQYGRLEAGYKADLVISDYLPPTPLVPDNIAGHLAFGMGSDTVKTVIVNGKLSYENRRFPFDIRPIYKTAQKVAQRLWNRMDKLDQP